IYDGFSASVIYGLESYGFCKQGEALDFIQGGRIALDGELPLNTFGGSLGTGRIHGLWHIIEGALRPPVAPVLVRSRMSTCRSSGPARRSLPARHLSSRASHTDKPSAGARTTTSGCRGTAVISSS